MNILTICDARSWPMSMRTDQWTICDARSWPMSTRTDQWSICDASSDQWVREPQKWSKKFKKIMFCEEYIDFRVYFLIWVLSARWSRSESRFRRTDQRPREPGWQIGRELTNARGAYGCIIKTQVSPLNYHTKFQNQIQPIKVLGCWRRRGEPEQRCE